MSEKMTYQMTEKALYDFMLYHTYSQFSGFLVNILGMAVIIMGLLMMLLGQIPFERFLFFVVAGIIFLAANPMSLRMRAKKYAKVNPEFSVPTELTFDDEGIHVRVKEKIVSHPWKTIDKAIRTPKTIGFYYSKSDAIIIPKEGFGERFMPVMNVCLAHMRRSDIYF